MILIFQTSLQIVIDNVNKENIGIYTCESANGIDGGNRNFTINVTETGQFSIPYIPI